MQPRILSVMMSLIAMLVASAITATFALTSQETMTLKSNKQKNDVVFNWGVGS